MMVARSLLLVALTGIVSAGFLHTDQEEARPPNIIFILTDDQRWDALGYTGNEIVRTPEMDRLAREGTYFQNAFVTTPICAASRASILTGMHERTHGYTFQQGPLKDPYIALSYPVRLRQAGYHTGFFGKLGVTFANAESLFDAAEIYDRNDREPNRTGYFYKRIDQETVHLTRYTGYKAQEFIRNAPTDRPFCLSLSFSAPHAHDPAPEQYVWQEKSDHLYSDVSIPPPSLGDNEYFDALPKEVREGFNRTRWHWRFDTPEKYQHSVKGYYRMITEVDEEIGEIRRTLQQQGIAENTVIIFSSDNGYYLGERQLAGKWLMHDNSLRVPLIILDPRQPQHRDVDDMVLNIDIPKTILAFANAEIPKSYQGMDLTSYVQAGFHPRPRKDILVEHLWELPEIPSSEGIRTSRWKYFRYRFLDVPEELYDLDQDPLETTNLAQRLDRKSLLAELKATLRTRTERYERARLTSD